MIDLLEKQQMNKINGTVIHDTDHPVTLTTDSKFSSISSKTRYTNHTYHDAKMFHLLLAS